MFSSDSPEDLMLAIRYYRRELRRKPDPERVAWLLPRERALTTKLVSLTGSPDVSRPRAWR